jgi:hypothetical protein
VFGGRGTLLLIALGLALGSCDSTVGVSGRAGNVSGSTTVSEDQADDPGGSVEAAATRNRPPSIRSLSGKFQDRPCFLFDANGKLVRGLARNLTFAYRDPDGNIRGGKVRVDLTFAPDNVSTRLLIDVPSDRGAVTGKTAGGVGVVYCLGFGSTTSLTEAVALLDSKLAPSNVLSLRTPRPAGAPQVLRPAGLPPDRSGGAEPAP